MFNALTIVVCILLALSFTYNIWLAYVADRYETTIKKVAASSVRAYRDLSAGATLITTSMTDPSTPITLTRVIGFGSIFYAANNENYHPPL